MRSFSEQCQLRREQNVQKLHLRALSAAFQVTLERKTLSRPEEDFDVSDVTRRHQTAGFTHFRLAHGLRSSRRMQTTAAVRVETPRGSAARSLRDVSVTPVRTPRIVALGGGTGLPAVLEGLAALAAEDGATGNDHLSAIVTVTDEGGSSGRLRREFGMLPPGDIRNCLAAIAGPTRPSSRFCNTVSTTAPGSRDMPLATCC